MSKKRATARNLTADMFISIALENARTRVACWTEALASAKRNLDIARTDESVAAAAKIMRGNGIAGSSVLLREHTFGAPVVESLKAELGM